jgi:hypothetical protein
VPQVVSNIFESQIWGAPTNVFTVETRYEINIQCHGVNLVGTADRQILPLIDAVEGPLIDQRLRVILILDVYWHELLKVLLRANMEVKLCLLYNL